MATETGWEDAHAWCPGNGTVHAPDGTPVFETACACTADGHRHPHPDKP